ncbi:uncharacterized protein GGS25DRAFT_527708 [Hypoxylon fragiforme]|uniref:uncharacterized protein n=1 Tax=Hypoxylon fragiforme TaxID=63214 RepID=UPI0020C6C385|nr:uncharacterized protein GGS25DRAFT_527708 [Hypoxylon fragiforme]KAI2614685.1 hypothetical protein GGS25DRAFT_527708 [Hypoxylon fragiforme]
MVYPSLEEEESQSQSSTSTKPQTDKNSRSSRPSFTDYWRRTKEAATKRITFVANNLEQLTGPSNRENGPQQPDSTTQAKAQVRRGQVRKAHIQHRQRKTNYTRQLEMDVTKLRDMIDRTERERLALKSENEAIRRRFLIRADSLPTSSMFPSSSTASNSLTSLRPAPGYTISLFGSSEMLDTPSFQVRRTPTPTSFSRHSGDLSMRESSTTISPFPRANSSHHTDPAKLSEAQNDYAVNFILALEHVCWDHFDQHHYAHQAYNPEAAEHGHALTATSIALQTAPPGVWEQLSAAKARRSSHQHHHHHHHQPSSSSSFASSSSSSSKPLPPLPLYQHSPPNSPHHGPPLASWETPPPHLGGAGPNLTLASLRALASSSSSSSSALTPPAELPPVQAWFEIVSRCGGAVDPRRLDRAREALAREARCFGFGAVVRREVFEGVVGGLLGC